jgi:hypothetical protein
LSQFEASPLFNPAERAALNLAPPRQPSPGVTEEHFVELKQHYSEDAIIEIVAVISLLGWLNRWNQTLATPLEASALDFAQTNLPHPGGLRGPGADESPHIAMRLAAITFATSGTMR